MVIIYYTKLYYSVKVRLTGIIEQALFNQYLQMSR